MGSRERLENAEKKTTSPQDILEYLDDLFAYALFLGMTYEQYWFQDPRLINAYIRAEEIRTMRKNRDLWLQGLYVHIAIGDLVPILNPFSKEHRAKKYLDKPIPLTEKEQEEEEQRKLQRFTNFMDSMVVSSQLKDNDEK